MLQKVGVGIKHCYQKASYNLQKQVKLTGTKTLAFPHTLRAHVKIINRDASTNIIYFSA